MNAGARGLKSESEVARSVAQPSPDDPERWLWSIRRYDADWIDDLETRLPCRLPAHFRSLVTRYIFPEFTCGNVLLFGNTPETIGYQAHELRIAIFHDRPLFEILSRHRYVQFGQPATGSYDPVCFAPSLRNRDAAVVRVDHEEILIRQRLHVVETLAPSFRGLLL